MQSSLLNQTVGDLVRENPARSQVFERFSIDYCCGGKAPLQAACLARGLDPLHVAAELLRVDEDAARPDVDPAGMGLAELADHIVATHHAWLGEQLPRLDALTARVAEAHGASDPRLLEVRRVFLECRAELESHMHKEERVLFPMIRALEQADGPIEFHCGSLANPIRMMEHEHDLAGDALQRLRELTDGYTPPQQACNTYRAMVDLLAAFERDMHVHVHKENSVLFPRAVQLESDRSNAGAV